MVNCASFILLDAGTVLSCTFRGMNTGSGRRKRTRAGWLHASGSARFPIDSKPGAVSDLRFLLGDANLISSFGIFLCLLSLFAPWTKEFSGFSFISFCISFYHSNNPLPTISLPGKGQGI